MLSNLWSKCCCNNGDVLPMRQKNVLWGVIEGGIYQNKNAISASAGSV